MNEEKETTKLLEHEKTEEGARMTTLEKRIEELETRLATTIIEVANQNLKVDMAVNQFLGLSEEAMESIAMLKDGYIAHDGAIRKLMEPRDVRTLTTMASFMENVDHCVLIREGLVEVAESLNIKTRGKEMSDLVVEIVGAGDDSLADRINEIMFGGEEITQDFEDAIQDFTDACKKQTKGRKPPIDKTLN